jgi:hypothetical protein
MDRRKSIKSIILGSAAAGLALHGCKPGEEEQLAKSGMEMPKANDNHFGRTPEEIEQIAKLNAEQFFNAHEMATMTVLCNLIVPANDKFGNASSVGVPDFIEFMAKDFPDFQTPIRGGLMWLDIQSNKQHNIVFKDISEAQQKAILDPIAFHDTETPMKEQAQEVQFFALMRNLTLTGYYTTEEGINDLGYKGNTPNVWDGVPADVLEKHGLDYEPEWLAKCVDQDKRGDLAVWDDQGNLLT